MTNSPVLITDAVELIKNQFGANATVAKVKLRVQFRFLKEFDNDKFSPELGKEIDSFLLLVDRLCAELKCERQDLTGHEFLLTDEERK